jgi:predicted DNA binding CopG/RHH family protein
MDIDWIKKVAENEGIPYQTLITSVVHKIATWQIKFWLYS